jgi:hypothetical protein
MSILMSRCKTSKWVRLTAVLKILKFKQKEKKRNGPRWALNHVLWSGTPVFYPLHHFLSLFNCVWFNGSKLILAVKMMKI